MKPLYLFTVIGFSSLEVASPSTGEYGIEMPSPSNLYPGEKTGKKKVWGNNTLFFFDRP